MSSRSPLVEAWFRGLPARLRQDPRPEVDLAELLALVHDVRQSLPGIALDDENVLTHLARWSGTVFPDRTTFSALHLPDLGLAAAAVAGNAEAIARFDRDLWKDLALAGDSEGRTSEEMASFRNDLLSSQSNASLLNYSGRGSLHAWLRVALLRRPRSRKRVPAQRELVLPEEVRALDLARSALEGSLKELSPEDRATLRDRPKGDPMRGKLEETLLLRTRRQLFSKGLEREKGEEALRVVWRGLGNLLSV